MSNGIVNVSAKDLDTNNEQSVTITSSSNMSEDEIERAKWEADIYSKQDETKGELVEMVISAENMIKIVSAMLKEHKRIGIKRSEKYKRNMCDVIKSYWKNDTRKGYWKWKHNKLGKLWNKCSIPLKIWYKYIKFI